MDKTEMTAQPRPVETPSATTSAHNTSGPLIYIAVAIVLGLMLLGSRAMARRMQAALGGIPARLEELAGRSDGMLAMIGKSAAAPAPTEAGPMLGQPVSITLDEALSLDLAIRSQSLDDAVDAYSYANADPAVSAYVRRLVTIDARCTASIDHSVRSALRDSSQAREHLLEARSELEACIEEIEGLEELGHPVSSECAQALESAVSALQSRYRSMENEVDLLLQDEEIALNTLAETDIEVRESTDEAAKSLEDALQLSKTR